MQRKAMLRARPAIACRKIAGGKVRHDLGGALDMSRCVHTERCEDAVIEEGAEWLAADLLDDAAEQHEVGIAVEVARAWLEVQSALAVDAVEKVLWLNGVAEVDAAQAHDLQHVADAGGVVHQVIERDAVTEVGEGGEVVADVVIGRQLALGREQKNGGAGELLADRGDAKRGSGADRHVVFDASETGTLVDGEVVAENDADGYPGTAGRAPTSQQAISTPAKEEARQLNHRRHLCRYYERSG